MEKTKTKTKTKNPDSPHRRYRPSDYIENFVTCLVAPQAKSSVIRDPFSPQSKYSPNKSHVTSCSRYRALCCSIPSHDRVCLQAALNLKVLLVFICSTVMAAEGYQRSSLDVQMDEGKVFIRTDVIPQPGDAILDLGCGTGELSAYLAELVGPEGLVVGVDPDMKRLNLAKETHREVKNLSFLEGNSDNFEGMGCEKYDIIFLSNVLHWIPNKQQAFKNMFSSLKEGGKIAIQYIDHLLPFIVTALEELTPEIEERFKKMFRGVDKDNVDRMCATEGFEIVKSYYANDKKLVFESVEVLLKWLWSSSHGVFDLKLVTEERIQRFLSRVGNSPFDFTSENVNSRLVAVKPKELTDVHNEGAE